MKKIELVFPEKKYCITTGKNLLSHAGKLFKDNGIPKRVLALVDDNLFNLHKDKLDLFLNNNSFPVETVKFTATEKNKNLKSVERIYSALQKKNFGRDTAIVAIGGGITGDVAGFAASTYMRGIKFVQVPTTLLSAVDSSVGGKTGVNFNGNKNFIGSFYQPDLVLIDTEFFTTLPPKEVICGLGEIIKTSFIAGGNLDKLLSPAINKIVMNDFSSVERVIIESLKFKSSVVLKDEKELGLRKILNFGHTFAHALEKESGFGIKHGQAVIFGIAAAQALSFELGLIGAKAFDRSLLLLDKVEPHIHIPPVNRIKLYNAMYADKKNRDGKIKFILVKEKGTTLIDVEADKDSVLRSIDFAVDYFHKRLEYPL